MTKLLHKPFKAFAWYSLIILVVSIPVYVTVVDYIWISELDENNWLNMQHARQKLQTQAYSPEEIAQIDHIWGDLQPGMSIRKAEGAYPQGDSVYEVYRPNAYDLEDGEDRFRGLVSPVWIGDEEYLLTIETNVEESDETFLAVAAITLFFFVVLMVGFVLLNRRIATRAWAPFYQILEGLRSFELARDRQLQLPDTEVQEFRQLSQSLEKLVKNNVAAYQAQKSFTENASHELQTPIAVLKSKLDLLLQEQTQNPALTQLLSGIEAPLARLSRINKNLLLLSKVENHQFADQVPLDVADYLQEALSLFEDYLEEKSLQLDLGRLQPCTVQANAYLLETLIQNLLSNAIRHSPIGGQISLQMEEGCLTVANSGQAALDTEGLFNRFSTTGNQKVSSGLGLAIIKEIANTYEWPFHYRFQEGMHQFSLHLS